MKAGDVIKFHGALYRIVVVHPLGTIDVVDAGGNYRRITGLPLS